MEILLGYAAGLLTLINPCVLPVLPIVLATALQASRWGPVVLAAGMSLSFVFVGVVITAVGRSLGITNDMITTVSALMMIIFGVILLVPRLSAGFSSMTGGLSAKADSEMDNVDRSGLRGQFIAGLLLGAVWSPCVGPTLGGAMALAFQGENLLQAAGIMVAFSLGVSTIILVLGYGARAAIMRRQATMRAIAAKSRPIMGAVFLLVGIMLYFNLNHYIEGWLLDALPAWLVDFSVTI